MQGIGNWATKAHGVHHTPLLILFLCEISIINSKKLKNKIKSLLREDYQSHFTDKEAKIPIGDVNLLKITVKLRELKIKPLSFGHQVQECFHHIKACFTSEKKKIKI